MGIQVVYDSLQSGAASLRSGPIDKLGQLKTEVTAAVNCLSNNALEHDGVSEQVTEMEQIQTYFDNIIVALELQADRADMIYNVYQAAEEENKEDTEKLKAWLEEAGFEVMDHIKVYENGNEKIREILKDLSEELTFHDFRMVSGPTHTNVIFDIVVPYNYKYSDEEIVDIIANKIHETDERFFAVIDVDKDFTDHSK